MCTNSPIFTFFKPYTKAIPSLTAYTSPNSSTLSSNFADIDSFLKGTYQNNLVDPRSVLKAQLKEQVPLNFFHRSQVFLPEPVDEKSCYRPHLV